MSDKFWSILLAIGVVTYLAFSYIDSINTENEYDDPVKYHITETTEWESDTDSDSPYVDSNYVDDRGTDECTEDCGGHSAGYDWAYENDVCDEDFEGGNSESFAEGVREYAYENC